MTSTAFQNSFIGGEFSPSLFGRSDLSKYQSAAKLLKNFIVQPHGGAANRPGLEYIEDSLGTGRLITFKFSTLQSYVLAFTDLRLRVLKDGGLVLTNIVESGTFQWTLSGGGSDEYYLEAAGGGEYPRVRPTHLYEDGSEIPEATPGSLIASTWGWGDNDSLGFSTIYCRISDSSDPDSKPDGYLQVIAEFTSPYSAADLSQLRFTQSFDTLFLAHKDYPPQKLVRTADDEWAFSTLAFSPSAVPPEPVGLADGLTAGSQQLYYKVSVNDSTTGEESLPTDPVRLGWDGDWKVSQFVFIRPNVLSGPSPYTATKFTASGSGTNEWYCELTAGGDPSLLLPSEVWERWTSWITPREFVDGTIGSLAAGEWAWGDNDSLGYNTIYVRDIFSGDPNVAHVSYKPTTTASYNIYKSVNGYYGFIGTTKHPWFLDDNILPATENAPIEDNDVFEGADNYPGATGLYEQRLMFSRTNNDPQSTWASVTNQLTNFSSSGFNDSDAIVNAPLYSGEMEEIRHIVGQQDLVILTESNAWLMAKGRNVDALTPSTFGYSHRSNVGANDVRPVRAGTTILYVSRDGKHVVDLTYMLQIQEVIGIGSYNGIDLTVLAPHLFKDSKIKEMAFQESPNRTLWVVMEDGTMRMMTFLKEQSVWCWSRFETEGFIESVAVITSEGDDEVYFLTRRTINGTVVRYLEKLKSRNWGDDQYDMFFVDTGVTYDLPLTITNTTNANPVVVTAASHGFSNGDWIYIKDVVGMAELNNVWFKVVSSNTNTFALTNPDDDSNIDGVLYGSYESGGAARLGVTTFSGLDHLEGEKVAILADASVISGKTVSGGSVTIDNRAVTAHIGLPYEAVLETLRIEPPSGGTLQGRLKSIRYVTVRLDESRGYSIEQIGGDQFDEPFRIGEPYSSAVSLFTGDIRSDVAGVWDYDGFVRITQPDPLPINILALVHEFDVGD